MDTIAKMVKHTACLLSSISSSQTIVTTDHLSEIDATLNLFYIFGETCKVSLYIFQIMFVRLPRSSICSIRQ